ncbi:MAG: MotA/TolQ/ExbB proton channel family protein [Bdellovibrionota bacterium]
MLSLTEAFLQGGIWMYLILFIATICVIIMLERLYSLFVGLNVDKEKFVNNVERAILAGDLNSAVNYCNDRKSPLNNIVKAGIVAVMNRGKDEEVQTAMDVAALREIPKIEKRTPFLPLLANVATLVGLLSTVWGLILSFQGVAGVDPAQKAALLARGVSEAMLGTAFGLAVAIPTLLVAAFLGSKTQQILDDIHEISVATLNLIVQNREKFPSK